MTEQVMIATKKTTLDHYREEDGDPAEELPDEEYEPIVEGHENHYESLETVESWLEAEGVDYDTVRVPEEADDDFVAYDLVVSLGGDGTALDASHYVMDDTPMVPVRSDENSHGALCQYGADEIEEALDDALHDPDLEEWSRAAVHYDGETAYALNDVFVADRHSMEVARYEISDGEYEEEHMNSGLVVSTGAGSTGWYGNVPGNEGTFPNDADELRYIEREPVRDGDQELNRGRVGEDGSLELRSKMNVDGIISIDCDREDMLFEFPRGATATVELADEPLRVVTG
ncbi:MAG: NAD(+)/NADH kinase [Candidatus Nanohaloarchaea archaeon]|nr:NAD(+)/NADH kinase [Candidatus Nanohaloarchaea archaeon]